MKHQSKEILLLKEAVMVVEIVVILHSTLQKISITSQEAEEVDPQM